MVIKQIFGNGTIGGFSVESKKKLIMALKKIGNVCYLSRLYLILCIVGPILFGLMSSTALGLQQVGLYDVWEIQVVNSNSYANPFDFNEIELQATFTSPSGKTVVFFGFYDGDGNGGQNGNVWKQRFMPDETGTWTYTYTWTDGTTGGSGSFEVVDTGLSGPLKIATDNPWYFMDSRGQPFHFRGYDMHIVAGHAPSQSLLSEIDYFKNQIQTEIIDQGYNFTMWDGLINRKGINDSNTWAESWWQNTSDTKRFNIPVWHAWENALRLTKDNQVYVINFAGMIYQGHEYNFTDFKVFLRYWVARFGGFYNYFGWSPTWEWGDIWSTSQVNQIMQYIYDIDPWKRMLSAHDHSDNSFSGWLGFSMRQLQSNTVFGGNIHGGGIQGGVGSAFLNQPIIGSEDIWEIESGAWGQPRNAAEVRRAAWGIMMAEVMPLYSEWSFPPPTGGNGTGEPEVRRMFDFFYSKTRYREYQMLNSLVSSSDRQICSGVSGQEYLVYDEDGGSITIDLSGASPSDIFTVLWFDPMTSAEQNGGNINGGAFRTLNAPFTGDSVLLLSRLPPDSTPPSIPQSLSAVAANKSRIDLTWQASSDPESGISNYNIYRDGANIGQSNTTSFSDTGLSEGATYTYEVSAVNGAGLESTKSTSVSATTIADTTSPTMTSVNDNGNPNQVIVVFSEPVEQASAENTANYNINSGIIVSGASLGSDLKTVTLTTSSHTDGVSYTLTVNNIQDRASTPNMITANSQMTYTFIVQLVIGNLTVSSGQTYEIVQNGLQDGVLVYIDRTYTYSGVPVLVEGAPYIKTANDDKLSGGSSFITFDVNQNVSVYVAHDDRVIAKPSWMTSFTDNGDDLVIASQSHSIWRKDFTASTITLGGNEGGSSSSMYTVIVVGQGTNSTPDTTPPAPPTGLTI